MTLFYSVNLSENLKPIYQEKVEVTKSYLSEMKLLQEFGFYKVIFEIKLLFSKKTNFFGQIPSLNFPPFRCTAPPPNQRLKKNKLSSEKKMLFLV